MAECLSYRFRLYSNLHSSPIWDIVLELRQIRFIFKDQVRGQWCQLSLTPTGKETDRLPLEIMQKPFASHLKNLQTYPLSSSKLRPELVRPSPS